VNYLAEKDFDSFLHTFDFIFCELQYRCIQADLAAALPFILQWKIIFKHAFYGFSHHA